MKHGRIPGRYLRASRSAASPAATTQEEGAGLDPRRVYSSATADVHWNISTGLLFLSRIGRRRRFGGAAPSRTNGVCAQFHDARSDDFPA